MKKGISLIVLVITIIVMIILAASVVITLSNTGIINRASEAVDLTNEAQVQDLAALIWADAFMDNKRGTDLVSEVTTKLGEQGVTADKWNIEVTNAGVTVNQKEQENMKNTIINLYYSTGSARGSGLYGKFISESETPAISFGYLEDVAEFFVKIDDNIVWQSGEDCVIGVSADDDLNVDDSEDITESGATFVKGKTYTYYIVFDSEQAREFWIDGVKYSIQGPGPVWDEWVYYSNNKYSTDSNGVYLTATHKYILDSNGNRVDAFSEIDKNANYYLEK